MKLNRLFILSFLTFLSTNLITFDIDLLSFKKSPVYAQETKDYPQTLEEAEEIRSRLPRLRAGTGNFFQLERSHPDYIETMLKAIDDLEKILPIYQKYGTQGDEYSAIVSEDTIVDQMCIYTLEIAHLANIRDRLFKYCSKSEEWVNIESLVEQYRSLGKYVEAIEVLNSEIYNSQELLRTQYKSAKSPEEWVRIPYWNRREDELNDIGNLYLTLGETYLIKKNSHQAESAYNEALKYFQESKKYLNTFLNEQLLAKPYIQRLYKKSGNTWAYRGGKTKLTLHYHGNIGSALLGLGKIPEAEENLRKSLDYYYQYRNNEIKENGYYKDGNLLPLISNSYNELQKLLINQERYEEVLELSEKTLSSSTGKSLLPELTINQIKKFAIENNITIVKYFLFDKQYRDYTLRKSEFAIAVIQPNGEIHLRQIDANNLLSEQRSRKSKKIAVIAVIAVILSISTYIFLKNKNISTLTSLIFVNFLVVVFSLGTLQKNSFSEGLFLSNLIYTTLDNFRINNDLTYLTALVKNKSCHNQDKCLKKLHQILIEPIVDLLPQNPEEHVVFIPQEYLSRVPFAALKDDQGKYLIEKHTIRTAPSIGILKFTNQLSKQKSSLSSVKALVVGNPLMPSVPIGMEWFQGEMIPLIEPLYSLPAAEEEAVEVANLLDTQPLIGNQATELAVAQQISDVNVIHLATHGVFLIDGSTALALTPSRKYELDSLFQTKPDDGILTPNEIENLDLNAELVVLSACDTALSPIMGDMGFAQPFLANGVPSVVVSLWLVPDGPTSELMVDFYNNLESIPDKAQALRQAMLNTKEKYPEPYNWAAFTLVGEK